MSFLAPIFLAGLVAVAAPIVWHLIRRKPQDTAPFPSLMFLEPAPPKVTKRSRLEDLILLALRILILALIATAFARPYFGKNTILPEKGTESQQVMLLVDASASMQRAGIWNSAIQRAETVLRKLSASDQAEIRLFDESFETVFSWDQWRNLPVQDRAAQATTALRSQKPGWKSTHLARALLGAAEALDTSRTSVSGKGPKPKIMVISDFQSGSRLEGLAGHSWPSDLEVALEPVSGSVENVSVHWFTESEALSAQTNSSAFKLRVQNHAQSKRDQFRVGWAKPGANAFAAEPLSVQIPPGQTRTITLPPPAAGLAYDGVWIDGDENPFDNRIYKVVDHSGLLRVLALTDEDPKSERSMIYFLQRAILETSRQRLDLITRKGTDSVSEQDLNGTRLVVLMEPAGEESWKVAASALKSGKTVLLALRGNSASAQLGKLFGSSPISIQESDAGDALWTRMDWEHPLLSVFADPRFSDFTKIRFWKHRKVKLEEMPGAKAVVSFEQGDPALIVAPAQAGQLILLTSSWGLEDSQLALSSKFVPLIYRTLEWSGALVETSSHYWVGSKITLPPSAAKLSRNWILPDGTSKPIAPDVQNQLVESPGIYQLTGENQPTAFAVDLSPEESKVHPMPPDELERLGVPVKIQPHETQPDPKLSSEKRLLREASIEQESHQKGWKWLLCGALALILIETGMTGWISRKTATAT